MTCTLTLLAQRLRDHRKVAEADLKMVRMGEGGREGGREGGKKGRRGGEGEKLAGCLVLLRFIILTNFIFQIVPAAQKYDIEMKTSM